MYTTSGDANQARARGAVPARVLRRRGFAAVALLVAWGGLWTPAPAGAAGAGGSRAVSRLALERDEDERPAVVYVNRIRFEGNHHLSDDDLRSRMRTRQSSFFSILRRPRFDRAVLERDLAHLEAWYHTEGFVDATVRLERLEYSDDRRFVDIVVRVDEGEPMRVETLTFSGTPLLPRRELERGLLLRPGRPYNANFLATDLYTLKRHYYERGYLAVAIRDSVDVSGRSVTIDYRVEPGTPIRVVDVVIEGNHDVPEGVIRRELTVRRGDVCTLARLTESRRNLFETGLFTVVDISPFDLDPLERTVRLRVRVRERRASYVEAGFGFGNIVGSRLSAEWGTRNLFSSGRTLRARAEYAYDIFRGDRVAFDNLQFENIYYRWDLVYQQRRILGTRVNLGIETFRERDATIQDIVISTLGGSMSAFRRFTRRTEGRVAFSVEDIERRALGAAAERSASHIVSGDITWDGRDFVLDPGEGAWRQLRVEIGGGVLGGRNDFVTASGTVQGYVPVRGAVFAWRLRVGAGGVYGRSTELPLENRFFLGGGATVRGYEENALGPRQSDEAGVERPVGGRAMLLGNVELRFPLPWLGRWNFGGAVFADGGNVWSRFPAVRARDFRLRAPRDEVTLGDVRYSVGLGLRYRTPVGPIRIDWAVPVKPDPVVGEHGRFHVTLGQVF